MDVVTANKYYSYIDCIAEIINLHNAKISLR